MTVNDFINLYDENEYEVEIEVKEYIPFQQKLDLCEAVIEDSMINGVMHSPIRNVLYRLMIIDTYTNIDIDYGNYMEEYDMLRQGDSPIFWILNDIDPDELQEFDQIMQQLLIDKRWEHDNN